MARGNRCRIERGSPTGEYIFPCIRGVYDKISGARARHYLYYAPHEAPGGICVAFADSLEGPFTEYAGNPLINRYLPTTTVSHARPLTSSGTRSAGSSSATSTARTP